MLSHLSLKVRRVVLYIAALAAYFISTIILNVDAFDLRRLASIVVIMLINQKLGATIVLRAHEKMHEGK